MPHAPYREPAEREKARYSKRRWFTRRGDSEQGPFGPRVIAGYYSAGVLGDLSLVRADDETLWRPLGSVDVLRPWLKRPASRVVVKSSVPPEALESTFHPNLGFLVAAGMMGLFLVAVAALARLPQGLVLTMLVVGLLVPVVVGVARRLP